MFACLAATAVVWRLSLQHQQDEHQAEFDFRVREITARIESRMRVYAQVLRGAQGMLAASQNVDRAKFRTYVEYLHVQDNYPGIQGIGIVLIVPWEKKNAHTDRLRKEGFPDYSIWPEGNRALYTSVIQLEPYQHPNTLVLGYDMYSEPVRREAMNRARDTASPSVSGKARLVLEAEGDAQAGFLMYLPLYRNGALHGTLEERQANIVGWVYMPFRMNNLMSNISGERAADLDIEIFDGEAISAGSLMYDTDSDPLSFQADKPRFSSIQRIEVGGHIWTLAIHSKPNLDKRGTVNQSATIAVIGFFFSLLLAWLTYLLASGRAMALAVVSDKVRELQESEEMLKFAMEGAGDGIWDWNVQTGEVKHSACWKEMLGYTEGEICNHVDEWRQRVHPEDLPGVLADMDSYFAGATPGFVKEHRLLCRDGSWKWILARGMLVSRTDDGRPLRMVGTHADISARKRKEERERDLKNIYSALSAINEAIILEKTESGLFSKVCRVAVEYGNMPLAWVGVPDSWGRFVPVASDGKAIGYLDGLVVNASEVEPEGRGAIGAAYRTGRYLVFRDMQSDEAAAPWRTKVREHGLRAGGAFPISRSGKTYAVFSVYSDQAAAFSEEIIQLLQRMADNVSFALDNLDRESKRKRNEAETRAIFENANDGIFIVDGSGRFIDVNERGAHMLGHSIQEILRLGVADVVAEEELPRIPADMANLEEMPRVSEWVFRCQDGSSLIGEVSAQMLPDGRILGIVRDVSERKKAEEELRRSEARYRALFEGSPDGIFLTVPDGRVIEANQAACAMLGMTHDEIIRQGRTGLVENAPALRNMLQERAFKGKATAEMILIRKDGLRFPVEISSSLIKGLANTGAAIVIARDVTERKRAEERLRLAALVFQNTSESMTVTDIDGNIIAINPAFTRLTGYTAEETVGKTPRILKSGWHDQCFYEAMWDSIKTRGCWKGEIWNRRKDGQIYPERLSISTVFNEDATAQCYVAMFQDITREKEAEATIRALSANHIEVKEQEGKRIAREIHDDLGQRLTLLRMDVLMLPKAIGEQGEGLQEAVARMRNAIDGCIAIARNIVAELRPAVLDFGIVPAIEWLLDEFERRSGIECVFHNMAGGEIALNDQQATGIFRILQESLTNVAKHAEATCIAVDLEIHFDWLSLTVSDNGIGIENAAFGQGPTYGMTGMRERAAMLGGNISITRQPQQGTSLMLSIPLSPIIPLTQ